ncbi:MAG: flavoprotein [Planctomycetota bacterium]
MNVLLGITGCIAAYKTPELVRRLRERGHSVRCILTANASRLVTEHALATVSGHPVASDMWSADARIAHIDRSQWCDCLLVAPATANALAKFALGLADDLLSTTFLALPPDKRVHIAPAMNTVMWHKPIVQQHVATLEAAGCERLGPVAGELACGDAGIGAMLAPEQIAAALD